MSKKHFQKLAYELMLVRPPVPQDVFSETECDVRVWDAWADAVDAVVKACEQSNPNFDRDRFLTACHADQYTPAMHGR